MTRPLIALDCDGVLLDFLRAYASAWERAFGSPPPERDPQAYWPMDRWQVERLDLDRRAVFKAAFDHAFWATLPALDGALQACHRLQAGGFDLVCVTALPLEFEAARLQNLRALGFPIERVVATGHTEGEHSPKAAAIAALQPMAFVDDYLPYMRGLPGPLHKALVLRAPNGSPNVGPGLAEMTSIHDDLASFADHWLAR